MPICNRRGANRRRTGLTGGARLELGVGVVDGLVGRGELGKEEQP